MCLIKNRKIMLFALAFVVMFSVVYCSAIVINVLQPSFMGFWTKKEMNTSLQVLDVEHKIITQNKVKTTITVHNPSSFEISFNLTVTYMNGDVELFSYNIHDTLKTKQMKQYVDINVFDITNWDITNIFVKATS